MSSFVSSLESSSHTSDSKYYNMKQFVMGVRGYLQTKSDDIAQMLNRNLQVLSVTVDLNMFDPNISIVSEFFMSLHMVLSNLEQPSPLAWSCVSVLSKACQNAGTRNTLIKVYEFIPTLSRLLSNQLTSERKIRLLSLMQELTCGIRISWQIPHLPHLMSTLTRWVESEDDEIVALSLGVLVNLCYKNLPALYTLSRCIDMKKFARICLPLKGVKIEMHVCKLLIVLDYMNGTIPEGALLKLIEVTFKSTTEAFKVQDARLLRHIVEFFLDVWNQSDNISALEKFKQYDVEVKKLLQIVENNLYADKADAVVQDPECMALLLQFVHSIIKLNMQKFVSLYPVLVKLAIHWVQNDIVCSEALAILTSIAWHAKDHQRDALKFIISGLPVFVAILASVEDVKLTNFDQCRRLCAVTQLMRALVQADSLRATVMEAVKEDKVLQVFKPLFVDSATLPDNSSNALLPHSVNLYVNGIALVNDLSWYDDEWRNNLNYLLQNKQVHLVLAQGLCNSSTETRSLILTMCQGRNFPIKALSQAMNEVSSTTISNSHSGRTKPTNIDDSFCFPVMSVGLLEKLDEAITKVKEACELKQFQNISTSSVMELYEYKLASVSLSERTALASVDTATQRCTFLQFRTEQLGAELARQRQQLFHSQQDREELMRGQEELSDKLTQLQVNLEYEKTTKAQLTAEKDKIIENMCQKLKESQEDKQALDMKLNEMKQMLTKLQDNVLKKEKLVEKKDEQLNRLTAAHEKLRSETMHLEKVLRQTEGVLAEKGSALDEKEEELKNCRNIITSITRIAQSQNSKG